MSDPIKPLDPMGAACSAAGCHSPAELAQVRQEGTDKAMNAFWFALALGAFGGVVFGLVLPRPWMQ